MLSQLYIATSQRLAMDDYEAYEDHVRYEEEFPKNQNSGCDDFFGMSDTTFVQTFRFCKEEVPRLTFLIKSQNGEISNLARPLSRIIP